jgi:hypothetical protein
MGSVNQELPAAWASPGQPGDVEEILRAVDKIYLGYKSLFEWEKDIYFTKFCDRLEPVQLKLQGAADHLSLQIEHLYKEVAKIFAEPEPSGTITIELLFTPPPGLESMADDINKLKRRGVI